MRKPEGKEALDPRCVAFLNGMWVDNFSPSDKVGFVEELTNMTLGGVLAMNAMPSIDIIYPDQQWRGVRAVQWDYEVAGCTDHVVYFRLSYDDKIEARKLLNYLQSL